MNRIVSQPARNAELGLARLPERIWRALDSVVGWKGVPVPLHEPEFAGNEWDFVKECLDTGWVSSAGKFVDRFERDLADFTGVKRAVAVVNGTSALHVALRLVGVVPGDEVLIPALTFVATANTVSYCGAVPHFVDSEEEHLGLDFAKLEGHLAAVIRRRGGECFNRRSGRRLSALIVMHTFGHPVDLDRAVEICQRYGLVLVEDAAESLGSYYKGRHTGGWGRVSILSFNGNKIATTGGGGAILTKDEQLADAAKHLTTTAKVPHPWNYWHDQVGYNYRLPNLNAALGCAQLEQMPSFIERKRRLAAAYQIAFKGMEGVRVVQEPSYGRSNYWLNALLLDGTAGGLRDAALEYTNERGIMTRPVWTLMHRLPMFAAGPRMDLSGATSLEARLINIPSSASLVKIDD